MKRNLPVLLWALLVLSIVFQGCGRSRDGVQLFSDAPEMKQSTLVSMDQAPQPIPDTGSTEHDIPGSALRTEAAPAIEVKATPIPAVTPSTEVQATPVPAASPATEVQATPVPTASPATVPPVTPPPAPKARPKHSPRPASAGRKIVNEAGQGVTARGTKTKTWTEFARQYPNSFAIHGASIGKRIALTFDDAPDERFTVPIIEVLRQHQVKATFFIIGSLAQKHPELVKRIKREGHVIGNHSSAHAFLPKKSVAEFERDMNQSGNVLESIVGYKPRLFRPPYGAITEEQLKWAGEHHVMVVNWNIDSLDWRGLSADEVIHNVMGHVGPGAIVLQHAGIGTKGNLSGTVQALPTIIEQLKSSGYELVTLPELLGISKEL